MKIKKGDWVQVMARDEILEKGTGKLDKVGDIIIFGGWWYNKSKENWVSKQINRTFQVQEVDCDGNAGFGDDFYKENGFYFLPHQVLKPAIKKLVQMINEGVQTMTGKEAIKCLLDGQKVIDKENNVWWVDDDKRTLFFQSKGTLSNEESVTNVDYTFNVIVEYLEGSKIFEEPKKRPMTRLEVLEKVVGRGGLIARINTLEWLPASAWSYSPEEIKNYEFAYITDGIIHDKHKAEVEE
jgi:hypothetical protein